MMEPKTHHLVQAVIRHKIRKDEKIRAHVRIRGTVILKTKHVRSDQKTCLMILMQMPYLLLRIKNIKGLWRRQASANMMILSSGSVDCSKYEEAFNGKYLFNYEYVVSHKLARWTDLF